MEYKCNVCNYASYDKFNYERHLKSKKHNEKVNKDTNHTQIIPISYPNHTELNEDTCQFCKKTFSNSSSLARHRKACNKQQELIQKYENMLKAQDIELKELKNKINIITESHEAEISKLNELLKKEMRNKNTEIDAKIDLLKSREDLIATLRSENHNLRTLLNNAGSVIQTSVSTLSYIVKNYTNAPALTPIPDLPKLHYDMTDLEFVDQLILEHRHKTLTAYIGDMIAKVYKKEDPKQQSIWNSDTSRLTYIIREIMHNQNLDWRVDKKGLKTSKYLIEPVLDYIEECIVKYMKKTKAASRTDSTSQAVKIMNNFTDANQILQMIEDKVLEEDILKYLAPRLYIVKNEELLAE
jgi:hypothetical protein|uniref:Zinc finger C2H2-type protein n=1 Tax=Fadolivirus 2 TaxID=2740747 RepID=A0A7D3UVL7_9VIRU|nr:zinc finger C2H2-type protein [Fadolivirus 2]